MGWLKDLAAECGYSGLDNLAKALLEKAKIERPELASNSTTYIII